MLHIYGGINFKMNNADREIMGNMKSVVRNECCLKKKKKMRK